jgi:Spy/CpxP family protein refolding chaperone
MMSKAFLSLLVACTLAASPALFAQDDGSATSSPSAGTGSTSGGNGPQAGKWKAAFAQLGLTDAQKAQIKQIRASTQPGQERRQQIMAVLTPEQKVKLAAMIKESSANQGSGQ